MKKKIVFALLAVIIVAAIGITYASRGRNGQGIVVQTEPVELREIVQTVTATGKIQPKTQVNISADVSAKIVRLEVEEGEWVEKGALLLELDRQRYLAVVESAEANLNAAEANANLARENMLMAEKDLERTRQLFDKKLESQAVLDTIYAASQVENARYQASLNQTEQARAVVKQAKDDLNKTTIYAPLSGTVSQLNKEQGEIALGSQFQEDVIMVLSNLAGMEALVDVDENDIVSLAIGDSAEIEVDALPDEVFVGVVTEIANTANISAAGTTEQKTEFAVKIAVNDPSPSLRPGMTASAEIVTDVREAAVSVPIQCVAVRTLEQLGINPAGGDEAGETTFTPDKDGFVEAVFVLDGVTVAVRQVTPGIQGESHIEIVEGLAEGEEVVVGSYRAISRDLRNGSEVETQGGQAGPQQG